jgi:hypothetical protein
VVISIYTAIEDTVRELRAEAAIASSGPFDSPQVIAGRLLALPSGAELAGIRTAEVLFEGEVYRFDTLHGDGSFELQKAW